MELKILWFVHIVGEWNDIVKFVSIRLQQDPVIFRWILSTFSWSLCVEILSDRSRSWSSYVPSTSSVVLPLLDPRFSAILAGRCPSCLASCMD